MYPLAVSPLHRCGGAHDVSLQLGNACSCLLQMCAPRLQLIFQVTLLLQGLLLQKVDRVVESLLHGVASILHFAAASVQLPCKVLRCLELPLQMLQMHRFVTCALICSICLALHLYQHVPRTIQFPFALDQLRPHHAHFAMLGVQLRLQTYTARFLTYQLRLRHSRCVTAHCGLMYTGNLPVCVSLFFLSTPSVCKPSNNITCACSSCTSHAPHTHAPTLEQIGSPDGQMPLPC